MTPKQRLEEILRYSKKATRGPWRTVGLSVLGEPKWPGDAGPAVGYFDICKDDGFDRPNATFTARSRTDLPWVARGALKLMEIFPHDVGCGVVTVMCPYGHGNMVPPLKVPGIDELACPHCEAIMINGPCTCGLAEKIAQCFKEG